MTPESGPPPADLVVARTTMLFSTEPIPGGSPADGVEQAVARVQDTHVLVDGADTAAWSSVRPGPGPVAIELLSPSFREVLDYEGAAYAPERGQPRWGVRCLDLAASVRERFNRDVTVTHPDPTRSFRPPTLTSGCVLVFPTSATILALSFDWGRVVAAGVRLLQDRFRAMSEASDKDWHWGSPWGPPGTLAELLLRLHPLLPVESHGRGHTSLLFSRRPPAEVLDACLFGFRRSGNAQFLPPPAVSPGDSVVWMRGNRVVGAAREGAVAVGWLAEGCEAAFEENWFAERFQGLYLRLAIHAEAERLGLATISLRIAHALARVESRQGDHRRKLLELAEEVATTTASLVGDDPAGFTDHAVFFRELRRVFGTPAALVEIRAEVREIHDLVQNAHDLREEATAAERNRLTKERDEADQRFQKTATRVGIVAAVGATFTGFLGMNVPFPWDHGWAPVPAGILAASLVAVCVLLGWALWPVWRGRSVPERVSGPEGDGGVDGIG